METKFSFLSCQFAFAKWTFQFWKAFKSFRKQNGEWEKLKQNKTSTFRLTFLAKCDDMEIQLTFIDLCN